MVALMTYGGTIECARLRIAYGTETGARSPSLRGPMDTAFDGMPDAA